MKPMAMPRILASIFFGMALLVIAPAWAAPNFPQLSTGPVVDAAGVLGETPAVILANKLKDYEATSGHQLAVATVPSLEGYDIRDYGNQLFRAWALGDKKRNDGVLVLVAPNEHKVSIEVGYGLEGDLTDALSSIIIQNAMVPRFKAGDYVGGINAGVEDIQKVIGGQGDQIVQRAQNQSTLTFNEILPFIILLIFVIIILSNASRGRRVIFIPGGGGFSGGGGFGGGGFSGGGGGWSGGGGSSGGGGASGGW
ncbi:MAG: TPM domain-containing protein [Alphaproteobacteria bacterium]|nr:TPM domain-containing protein [Alphaproteobacteria bacterium]